MPDPCLFFFVIGCHARSMSALPGIGMGIAYVPECDHEEVYRVFQKCAEHDTVLFIHHRGEMKDLSDSHEVGLCCDCDCAMNVSVLCPCVCCDYAVTVAVAVAAVRQDEGPVGLTRVGSWHDVNSKTRSIFAPGFPLRMSSRAGFRADSRRGIFAAEFPQRDSGIFAAGFPVRFRRSGVQKTAPLTACRDP